METCLQTVCHLNDMQTRVSTSLQGRPPTPLPRDIKFRIIGDKCVYNGPYISPWSINPWWWLLNSNWNIARHRLLCRAMWVRWTIIWSDIFSSFTPLLFLVVILDKLRDTQQFRGHPNSVLRKLFKRIAIFGITQFRATQHNSTLIVITGGGGA